MFVYIYIYIYIYIYMRNHNDNVVHSIRAEPPQRRRRSARSGCTRSTAKIYTYTPLIYYTVYLCLMRGCK